jgi:hypothetical protein
MVSQKKFYKTTHTFATTQSAMFVIILAVLVAARLHSVSSAQTKFGGHKFKRDCDVKTAVTRWLTRDDMDSHQHGIEKLAPRYGIRFSFGCACLAKQWDSSTIKSELHKMKNQKYMHCEIIV